MKTLILKGYKVFQNQGKHNVSVYAAQASYFIMLAVFPAIMLLLSLIRLLPFSETEIMTTLSEVVPEVIAPLLDEIINDLYTKTTGTVLSLSVLTAVWSAAKGVMGIERGLLEIHGIEESRKYIIARTVSALYTVAFVVVFVFSLVLLVFGNGIQIALTNRFPMLAQVTGYIISIRTLLSITILTTFFMFLYKYIPKRKTTLVRQLPGALFSTFGWILFSFFFSIYVDNFGNFSYMYGSLTTVVLLMLWLYVCIYIVFLGAEINVVFVPES